MVKIDYKIKASAMFYALFLLSIVSIVIAGLFQLSALNQSLEFKLDLETKLINNSKSGLAYAKSYFAEIPQNKSITVQLFDEGIDSVIVSKSNWGAYQILKSKAIYQSKSFTSLIMVGSKSKIKYPNLYLADQGRPLSLCGKTRLEGKCALPKLGVKRAYIAGENYQGKQLIYGNKRVSEKQLPKINNNLILNMNLVSGQKQEWSQEIEFFKAPFDSSIVHYYSNRPIFINTQTFIGQIIIESKDSIVVSSSAILKDVILKSPKIIIEENFRGNLQCLATQKIELKEGVILEYPSVLGLVETKQTKAVSEILLSENAQVLGSVFLLSEAPNFRQPVKLLINNKAVIHGLVYCNGETELKGKVNGTLYTQSFYLKTASSAYQNHLLNAEITNELPISFIPIPLLEESNQIKIIKWLK